MRYSDIVAFWLNAEFDATEAYCIRAYNMSGVPTALGEGDFKLLQEVKNPDGLCTLTNADETQHFYSRYQIEECRKRVATAAAEFVHAPHYAVRAAEALLRQLWDDDKSALRSGLNYFRFLRLSYVILSGLLARSRQVNRGIVTMHGALQVDDTLTGAVITSNHPMRAGGLFNCSADDISECWCLTEPVNAVQFIGLGMNKYRERADLTEEVATECLLLTADSALYTSLLLTMSEDAARHEYTYTIKEANLPLLLTELKEL